MTDQPAQGLSLNLRELGGPDLRLEGTSSTSVRCFGLPGVADAKAQPLVEVLAAGHGREAANLRNTRTAIGSRLIYTAHTITGDQRFHTLEIDQQDPTTGIEVRSTLRVPRGAAALQAWTTVRNAGATPVHLQAVSSFVVGDPLGATDLEQIDSIEGASDWVGESRWSTVPLRSQDGLVALALDLHQHQDARGARTVVSQGAWSSGQRIPTGVIARRGGGPAMAWQVDHNGAWRVELGERLSTADRSSLVLGLFGPTDADHAWLRTLAPGESFTSVPVSVAFSEHGWEGAIAELTQHRRALRDSDRRPAVVFNDYMNTLMGDPTTAKLEPLIRSAASVGAEYFCIDAGWYDDGGDWWDSVGQWEPSTTRFPGRGLGGLLSQIREAGMVPGLWLEPEVVGVRSPVADQLPHDAFLQRRGVRIVEHGRYLLDLRSADAVKHLDAVVDRLVDELGVGYLKLDYNVTPGTGTDRAADSPGDGLLGHNRAHLEWIDGVRERHPDLVIENCASGAMRADYAMLARTDLQSTSDQQDPLRYPPIAAGALVSILPEQAANWAYPQPEMTEEALVFTLCTGLSGLLYLSGRLDQMDDRQRALVAEAVGFARGWADQLQQSVPVWPLGLPGWSDPWVAVGLQGPTETLVAVWWRGEAPGEVVLDLPAGSIEIAYPSSPAHPWHVTTDGDGRTRIRVTTDEPQARILRIAHPPLA